MIIKKYNKIQMFYLIFNIFNNQPTVPKSKWALYTMPDLC